MLLQRTLVSMLVVLLATPMAVSANNTDAADVDAVMVELNRTFLRELLRHPEEMLLAYVAWQLQKPTLESDPRFVLYETQNMWTFLLLDTTTGRIWQVVYSVSDDASPGRVVINDQELVSDNEPRRHGRFTLHPTANIWTFILLDQDTGSTWQVQFSMSDQPGYRWIRPIIGN